MQNETKLRRRGKALAPLCLLAAFLGVLPDARAQNNPPANDNLTNAQPVGGLTGTVTGNNLLATTELGEPAPVSGVLSGASIWYVWTAPMTRFMDFDTHNSTDPTGNTLNTAMAVYTSTGAAAYASLVQVTNNANDPNTNSWPGVSRVNFLAAAGTTYYIQLEGKVVAGVTNEGYMVLNWSPAVAAGTVSFSTNLYAFGQLDNGIPAADITWGEYIGDDNAEIFSLNDLLSEQPNPNFGVLPSLMNTNVLNQATNVGSTAATGQGRVTLVRTGGYNGRMQVDLSLAADTYSNFYTTNIWITTIYIGPSDDLGNELPGAPDTNITIWVTNLTFQLGYDVDGLTEFYIFTNSDQRTLTTTIDNKGNVNTTDKSTASCGNYNGPPKKIGQLPTSISTNVTTVGTNSVTNYTVSSTNITVEPETSYGFLTPSAVDGTDFDSTDYQTITFDDFQMSKDAFVNITPDITGLIGVTGENELLEGVSGSGGPDWPDILGNDICPGIPRRVILTLSNPRLDPLETLDVAAPTLATNGVVPDLYGGTGGGGFTLTSTSVAEMTIADFFNTPIPDLVGGGPCTTNSVFNLERRTLRCFKPRLLSAGATVTIYVFREGSVDHSSTINYTIDAYGSGGVDAWGSPYLDAGSDYAIGVTTASTNAPANYDFVLPNPVVGSISFPKNQANDIPEPITITLNNNGAVEFDEEFEVELSLPQGANSADVIGNVGVCNVAVLFDNNLVDANGNITYQQPGGAADRNWNPELMPVTSYPPFNSLPGANQEVDAIAIQGDGKAVVGGQFATYDTATFNYLARTLTNGLPDFSFKPGSGPNDFVAAVAIDHYGRILIGGNFTSFNGVEAYHVARLNGDGSLDTSFNTGSGANGTVWAMAVDSADNVIIGGDFTQYNSTNRNHIARLIGDGAQSGSLDTRFDPGSGPDQTVRAVAVDSLANVVMGGPFQNVAGTNWPGVARLTPSGALDTNFNPGTGVNGPVYSVAVSPENQIVIGGSFSQVGLTNLNCIARLNYNGSVDFSFGPGAGVNGPVYAVAIQPDQNIVLGGQFTSVGTVRRIGYARLLASGWVDTSFMDTSYNQFAGLINHYYNPDAVNTNDLPPPANYNSPNYVNAIAIQPNTNILIGGSFVRVGGGLFRSDVRVRWNLASVIGAPTLGPQAPGGGIGNCPGNVGFTQSTY
ncbi:MAG: delta-60 repeat domain-containing protein, partial [Verrucomicrobiota bacterium]